MAKTEEIYWDEAEKKWIDNRKICLTCRNGFVKITGRGNSLTFRMRYWCSLLNRSAGPLLHEQCWDSKKNADEP